MNRNILLALGITALIVFTVYVNLPKLPAEAPVAGSVQTAPILAHEEPFEIHPSAKSAIMAAAVIPEPADPSTNTPVAPAPWSETEGKLVFDQAIQGLLSPQTSYEQRQAIWKQLKDSAKLGQAITELEQRVAADPNSANTVTALGEGYYKEAGATKDVREQALFAMKADQTLEAALNLDSTDWEARFTKTVGISYWPPELNKGSEVIEQFQTLIQQQESEAQQPQFAQTYLLLGQQYQKAGQSDLATQIWQRGLAWFPNNTYLQGKLAASP